MRYTFHWSSDIADGKRAATEEAIREGQESGDSPITFCHDGPAVVTLELSKAFPARFDGVMRCACGKTRGIIQGKCNGSSVTFEAANS